MPAINLTIMQQGTKRNLNDRAILDQRITLEAQNTGNKTGVKAKQTNQPTYYIKIMIYLFFTAKVCYRNRGSKGCLSLETKTRIHLGTQQKG